MRLVRIIAEESSNLEEDFARNYKISVIPFNVINRDGKLIKISSSQKEKIEEGLFRSKDSFELKQLYAQNEHIGAKLEIKIKEMEDTDYSSSKKLRTIS